MHFARAEPCNLIRTLGGSRVSRMLYLIEPSEIDLDNVHDSYSDYYSLKLDTRLKIPLRNVEMLPLKLITEPKSSFGGNNGKHIVKKRFIKVTTKEQKFQIVNSCNGFLCLSDPLHNNPLVVCNPITGEYLKLPKTDDFNEDGKDVMFCGFGFSNKSNQFKVLIMFEGNRELCRRPITGEETFSSLVAEVHTVGTGSWRRIGHAPFWARKLKSVTYVGGSYWIRDIMGKLELIYSFDFNEEKFRAIKPPPFGDSWIWGYEVQSKMTLGMLGGRLILCTGLMDMEEVQIWVLENDDELANWKEFKTIHCSCERWPLGSYLPINFRNDKGLLMFQSPKSAFFYYAPVFHSWKYFRIYHVKAKYEAIFHIPSFIMLKDIVKGDCVEVLNVNSRCSTFKLLGETKPIFLVEEIREAEVDTGASGYTDG